MNYRVQFWYVSHDTLAPRFRIEQSNNGGKWEAINGRAYSAPEANNIVQQIIAGEAEYIRVPSVYKLIKIA